MDKEKNNLIINERNYTGTEFNERIVSDNLKVQEFNAIDAKGSLLKEEKKYNDFTKEGDRITSSFDSTATASASSTAISTTGAVGASGSGIAITGAVIASGAATIGVVAIGLSFAAFNATIKNFQYQINSHEIELSYDFAIGYNIKGLVYVRLKDNNGMQFVNEYEVLENEQNDEVVDGYTYASHISGHFINNQDNQNQIAYNTEYQLSVYTYINKEERALYTVEEKIVFANPAPVYESPSLVGEFQIGVLPNKLAATFKGQIYTEDISENDEGSSYGELAIYEADAQPGSYPFASEYYYPQESMSTTYGKGVIIDVIYAIGNLTADKEYKVTLTYYQYNQSVDPTTGRETTTTVLFESPLIINSEDITNPEPYCALNYYYVNYASYSEGSDSVTLSYEYYDNGVKFTSFRIDILSTEGSVLSSVEAETIARDTMVEVPLENLTRGHSYPVVVYGLSENEYTPICTHSIYY